MNLAREFETLVVVGLWNKSIFNPDWVGKFLFPDREVAVEYPLNFSGSHRFTSDGVRVFVIANRLNFAAMTPGPESLRKIDELAHKIADFLPHTPIKACGMNAVFELPYEDRFNALFENGVKAKLPQDATVPITSVVKNSFKKNSGTLSITVLKENGNLKIDFNLHTEIKDLIKLKEELDENPLIEYQDFCKRIGETIISG